MDLARSIQSFLPSGLGPEKQEEAPLLNLVMERTPATVWVGGGVREFISLCSGKGSHFATKQKKQSRRSPRARLDRLSPQASNSRLLDRSIQSFLPSRLWPEKQEEAPLFNSKVDHRVQVKSQALDVISIQVMPVSPKCYTLEEEDELRIVNVQVNSLDVTVDRLQPEGVGGHQDKQL